MNDKISDWILEHVTGVHSGINVRPWCSNNGKQRGKLQRAVIEWASAGWERGMEIDTNKSETKRITKEYRED
jgi:hypothetical protein